MRTRLATIFAASTDQEHLVAQHDRCVEWATKEGHVIRDRILLTSDDSDAVCDHLEELARSGKLDLLVMESLSALGRDGCRAFDLLNVIDANKAELVCLKEGQAPETAALFAAYCPNTPAEAVYSGEFGSKTRAQEWAATLGWSVEVPRRRKPISDAYFNHRRDLSAGKVMLIEGLRTLPDKTHADRLRRLMSLQADGQRYFLLYEGLDSAAPNHLHALKAAIIAFENKPITPTLPAPSVFFVEWADRKLKRNKSSITSYLNNLGLNSKIFFYHMNSFLDAAAEYVDAHDLEAAVAHFSVPAYALEYGLRWRADRESRSRSRSDSSS